MSTDAEIALNNLLSRDEVVAATSDTRGARRRIRKTRRHRGGASDGDIICSMMTIRDQVKLYHWQTRSFARHKATDDLVTTLDTNIDTFVETYMGKYGRPRISKPIKLTNFSEYAAKTFVERQRSFLTKTLPSKLSSQDTDLLNIRDEILASLNQVLYLFSLN